MELEHAQADFKEWPSAGSMLRLLKVATQYWEDAIIGDEILAVGVLKPIHDWLLKD